MQLQLTQRTQSAAERWQRTIAQCLYWHVQRTLAQHRQAQRLGATHLTECGVGDSGMQRAALVKRTRAHGSVGRSSTHYCSAGMCSARKCSAPERSIGKRDAHQRSACMCSVLYTSAAQANAAHASVQEASVRCAGECSAHECSVRERRRWQVQRTRAVQRT